MAKYLVMWESDMSRASANPKEQMERETKHVEMTKQAMKEGQVKDWGVFVGGHGGYALCEGIGIDRLKGVMPFYPYLKFNVQEVLTLGELSDVMKSMAEVMKS